MTLRRLARAILPLGLIAILGFVPSTALGQSPSTKTEVNPPVPLSPTDRARLEAEAAGQSTEADRRFKAGDHAGALPLYRAERTTRAKLGDRRFEAYAIRSEGCCFSALGDAEAAIALWLVAAEIDRDREDPGLVGYDWLLIGDAYNRLDRPLDAAQYLERALPKLSGAIDQDHEADARVILARVLVNLDRAREAVPHASRAADLASSLKDQPRLASAWIAAGLADARRGEPGLAAERFSDAIRILESLDQPEEVAPTLRVLGEALADLGHLPSAIAAFEEAAGLLKALGNEPARAELLDLLAAAQADSGAWGPAAQTAREAFRTWKDLGEISGAIEALVRLAHFRSQAGDREAAADAIIEALTTQGDATTPARRVRLLLLSAGLERQAGRLDQARKQLDAAEDVAKGSDNAALRRLVSDARALANPDQAPSRP